MAQRKRTPESRIPVQKLREFLRRWRITDRDMLELTPREREALISTLEGKTRAATAVRMGIGRCRVEQLLLKARQRLERIGKDRRSMNETTEENERETDSQLPF